MYLGCVCVCFCVYMTNIVQSMQSEYNVDVRYKCVCVGSRLQRTNKRMHSTHTTRFVSIYTEMLNNRIYLCCIITLNNLISKFLICFAVQMVRVVRLV